MRTSAGVPNRRFGFTATVSFLVLFFVNSGIEVHGFTSPALMTPSISHPQLCNSFDMACRNGIFQKQSFPSLHSSNSGRVSTTSLSVGTAAAIAGLKTSLHSNVGYVLTLVLWLSTFGTSLERRTTVGKALSAPLATMALALAAANIGVIPFYSPIYTMVNRFLVPLAVPLLLFDSDLKRVINDTGTLLAAFCVGAFATVLATIVAFPVIPLKSVGPDVGWRVACALAARHIGGAINFVAVAETLNIGGDAVAAASTYCTALIVSSLFATILLLNLLIFFIFSCYFSAL